MSGIPVRFLIFWQSSSCSTSQPFPGSLTQVFAQILALSPTHLSWALSCRTFTQAGAQACPPLVLVPSQSSVYGTSALPSPHLSSYAFLPSVTVPYLHCNLVWLQAFQNRSWVYLTAPWTDWWALHIQEPASLLPGISLPMPCNALIDTLARVAVRP